MSEVARASVSKGVGRVKWISGSFRLGQKLGHIIIVDRVVDGLPCVSFLWAGAEDVAHIVRVAGGELFDLLWSSAFDIINLHSVSKEARRIRFYVFDFLQLVSVLERVGRLSRGVELVPLRP